ncbi:unnamed protein product, partial [Symbiodinium pilosum]
MFRESLLLARPGNAMAALKTDGTVVAWGQKTFGGDCSERQAELVGVYDVFAADAAFAALKEDGTVVAWGHAEYGG